MFLVFDYSVANFGVNNKTASNTMLLSNTTFQQEVLKEEIFT